MGDFEVDPAQLRAAALPGTESAETAGQLGPHWKSFTVGDSGPVLIMRLILTLTALLALLAGCTNSSEEVTVEFDEDLEKALGELARSGGSRPLKELAPGDWTSVHVLIGPASGARIEQELGHPADIEGDGTSDGDFVQDGNLLVFQRGDEIVRMVNLGQLAALGEGNYRADVVLRANGGAITMTDPDGRPAG
jgi:hypothetical protein